ncbi:MAG: PhnD/SsuA/transferrin family substrate-binding protein, partial [Chloroflexota bacterium]|nr:PhnD/SsuA/transferrin family substrate-binding protein [Chloroflexota bacterium]
YTGGHDATALAVQNGTVAAGGLEERILNRLIERGVVDESKIRIVARSEPIEGYPWVIRDELAPELVESITNAFLEIEDAELLKLLRAERYERVEASDYEEIRREARRLGILQPAE